MYNYLESMKDDIKESILYNYTKEEIQEHLENRPTWEVSLYDELWIDDSVTGNGSGSYWFNSWKAGEALQGNWDLLQDALEEFGEFDINPIEKGEEWCDVTIRCYLLGRALFEVLDELEEE